MTDSNPPGDISRSNSKRKPDILGAKVRKSERKAKRETRFSFSFPSESTLDEVKGTKKRAKSKKGNSFFFFFSERKYLRRSQRNEKEKKLTIFAAKSYV
ncbi:MAG: hypothetical protein J5814_09885 [Bacteroidaceae bacterium]|nr:hypothetical protein [Bacteroidaceae bacterium]